MLPLSALEDAYGIVQRSLLPTPQISWPMLSEAAGCEVWVKHENHTPIGAFKVRGGLVHLERMRGASQPEGGIISATRGNHGQSLAFAARQVSMACTLVVPHGNSTDKNAAMRAFGADLIEEGHDFDAARDAAERIAGEKGAVMVPSFHEDLVAGVGTYSLELFTAVPDLDTLYVPIGLGSGICGAISARNGLNLKTKIVGVVSEHADSYAKSFEAGRSVPTNSAATFADGMAVRNPHPDALEAILAGVERIVRVSDTQIADAVRLLFHASHNIAEGAGAAPLAALLAERNRFADRKVAVVLSGGNIDAPWFARILDGGVPQP